jgi:hypothetical protein
MSTIFEIGDLGRKFYIILNGEISLMQPISIENDEGILLFT